MIFVVDDDVIMAECVRRACLTNGDYDGEVRIFGDGVAMMEAIGGGTDGRVEGEDGVDDCGEIDDSLPGRGGLGEMPELIFLDMMLTGPDGLAVLHELASYEDTAKVPVVVMSGLDLAEADLAEYGVVRVLDKGRMRPEEIGEIVREVKVGRGAWDAEDLTGCSVQDLMGCGGGGGERGNE